MTAPSVEALDARYKPLPAFGTWSGSVMDDEPWRVSRDDVRAAIASANEEQWSLAFDLLLRAIAIDDVFVEELTANDGDLSPASWPGSSHDIERRGQSASEVYAAHRRAYQLVVEVATHGLPITPDLIRTLHREICASQDTYRVSGAAGRVERALAKGEYKREPNHVRLPDGTFKAYAPVESSPLELERLVKELRTVEFARAHPANQAAYALWAMCEIHPFADGNGRVARALASVFLYRAVRVPLVVLAADRPDYVHAFDTARAGDHSALVRFVVASARAAMALLTEALRTVQAPDRVVALQRLHALATERDRSVGSD